MGNSVNQQEVKDFIDEMSETSNVNEQYIKEDCSRFLEVNGRFLIDKNFESSFIMYFVELKEDQMLNFLKNSTKYLKYEIESETHKNLKFTLDLINIILQAIYKKYNNLRELFSYSVSDLTENTNLLKEDRERVLNVFPLYIIKTVFLYINQIEKNKGRENVFNQFQVKSSLVKIIYYLIYYQKTNDYIGKTYVEFFDPFKILLENLLDSNDLVGFLSFIFNDFCQGIKVLLNNKLEKGLKRDDLENYVKFLLNILIFFIFDLNKFFFIPLREKEFDEVCFENDYNEKIFKFIINQVFNKQRITDIITNYNKSFHNIIISVVQSNTNVLNDFIISFFTNYEKFNVSYRKIIKILIIYFLEVYENYSELLCLNKDFIYIVVEKLTLNDFYDLILYNKLTLCKNFYIMAKYLNEYSSNEQKKISKIMSLCEKCLDVLFLNKKGQIKMDHITYFLLLMISNLSLFIVSLNDTILLKLSELVNHLALFEIKFDNYYEHLILTKFISEIILNFLFNIEFPSTLILFVLKHNNILVKIDEEIRKFNENNPTISDDKEFKEYCEVYSKIQKIMDKFKSRIDHEGANIRFTQNTEILRIINKISISKNEIEYQKKFKENIIFNTDTEKHIILTVYQINCENEDLLKK